MTSNAFLKPRSQVRFLPGTLLFRRLLSLGARARSAVWGPYKALYRTKSVHGSLPYVGLSATSCPERGR